MKNPETYENFGQYCRILRKIEKFQKKRNAKFIARDRKDYLQPIDSRKNPTRNQSRQAIRNGEY
jgi:hypothetical protein